MITDRGRMIRTAVPDIYNFFVEKRQFLKKHHLFSLGLVYGVLLNLKSDQRPSFDMVYLNQIREDVTIDSIDFIFTLLNDGRSEIEIFEEMLAIADAGIKKLKEIYDERNDIPLAELIQDSSKLWAERITELKVLDKSHS